MRENKLPVFIGTEAQEASLNEEIAKYKGTEGALMPILHKAQEIYGYLPYEVQTIISKGLGVSMAEIYGVITFYSQFTLYPKGQYKVAVCLGTACYVKGSGNIIDRIKTMLEIEIGETTEDGKFSLDATRCIGACGLAPVLTVNDDVYGRLALEDIDDIIKKYQNK